MEYISEPMQRKTLREFAKIIRKKMCVEDIIYLPVVTILENIMPLLFPGFTYDIVRKSELPDNRHAETDVVNKIVKIREDVYLGAINGNGRDRMTIMHEIAHYILIVVYGVKFARNFGGKDIRAYKSPEWQAKALAGEIMCPHNIIKSLSVEKVAKKCGVSISAAKYNLNH